MLSDGCFWRIKLATSLLQLLYCNDPHRTVGILLCVFALIMTVNFLMLSTQPDFLRHGLAFPSPPRKTASSSLTDGQSVLPLLVLLTFGGSIHGSFYLNQSEALYATPTTRMILFVLCHLMSSFLYPKELCSHERFHQLFLQFQADILCLQPNYLVASLAIASPAQISGRVSIEPRYLKRSNWLIALHWRTSCSFAANRTQHSTIY